MRRSASRSASSARLQLPDGALLSLLGSPSLADVVRDLRGADDDPVGTADRRDGERHVDPTAALGHPDRLEVIDALALAQLREDLLLLLLALRRNDQRDRLPDGLVHRVAEQPLRGPIPGADDAFEGLAHDGILGGLHDSRQMRAGALRQPLMSDIAHEPAAMDQLARIPLSVGGDAHVADRAVAAAQYRRMIAQRLACKQLPQRLRRIPRVEVKRLDRPPDALRLGAAQQLQGGAVDPEHRAVGADLEKPFQRTLEEVTELTVPIGQLPLHHDAPLHFPLERARFLLQLRDLPESCLRRRLGIALGGNDPGMLRANTLECRMIGSFTFRGQRIRAVERERLTLPELVPQLLELHGGLPASLSPQQCHHLAEGDHPGILPPQLREDRAQHLHEPTPLRHSMMHDPGEDG